MASRSEVLSWCSSDTHCWLHSRLWETHLKKSFPQQVPGSGNQSGCWNVCTPNPRPPLEQRWSPETPFTSGKFFPEGKC